MPSAELFVNLMEGTRWAGKPDNVVHICAGLPVLIQLRRSRSVGSEQRIGG